MYSIYFALYSPWVGAILLLELNDDACRHAAQEDRSKESFGVPEYCLPVVWVLDSSGQVAED
jgi:hypothetical protein